DATDNEFENHVQIEWTDVSNFEKGYYVFRQPLGGTPIPLDTLSANRTTFGDYTGTPGVQFNYLVRAFDDHDTSSADEDLGKRTLEPPTGMEASDGTSETVVEIEWKDNSSAEKGYNVYRRAVGAADSALAGRTGKDEPAYSDIIPDSMLGVEFDYIVTAFDDYGESLRATDRGKTVIESPANVNASDVYDDRAVVVWIDNSEIEDGFRLTRRQVDSGGGIDLNLNLPPGSTMYTDQTGSPGVDYQYCVASMLQSNGTTLYSTPSCDVGSIFRAGGGGGTPGVTAYKWPSPYPRSTYDIYNDYGKAVAIEGMTTLVGGPGVDRNYGGILGLFSFDDGSGLVDRFSVDAQNTWTPVEAWPTITGLDQRDDVDFGYAIDLDDPYAIVGDPGLLQASRGAFSVWKRSGANWSQVIRKIEVQATGDNTGISVALSDSFAVVGNSTRGQGLPNGHGSAVICNIEAALRNSTDCGREDGIPRLENVLTAAMQVEDAAFGEAVGITRVEDSLYSIIGAPGNDLAYIFKCDLGTDCDDTSDWSLLAELNTRFRPGNQFGAAVAINSKLALVGAPGAGGMVVYERDAGEWVELVVFKPESGGLGFGSAIAVNDSSIIVGAPNEELGGHEDAGAVYVYQWDSNTSTLVDEVRYDARVAAFRPGADGVVLEGAMFGAAVDLNNEFYLVGAPRDDNDLFGGRDFNGAVYSIPVGFDPPESLILPPGVDLAIPGDIRASDGTAPDRIQIRWEDESDDEDGHTVFRTNAAGEIEELSEVSPNIEFFDDFEAAPGEAYTYCVAAFYEGTYTEMSCDIGWRPPNGTIAGRLSARQGGGTEDARVCLVPSPNMSLLFDGHGGYVEAALGEDDLDLFNNFTIEAWVRPHATDGVRYVASKDSAFALAISGGKVRFELVGVDSVEATSQPPMTTGNWYHIAASMDRDRKVSLYLDGVKQAETTFPSLGALVGDTLTIGQRGDGSGFFKGEIDEVRIWDVALADSLIDGRRFIPLEGEEENLVAYWPLDQGKRLVAPDISET
ncbi:MAG: hypothetical protein PVF33_13960, partial [Candidatus Latescibacterota bacterium]